MLQAHAGNDVLCSRVHVTARWTKELEHAVVRRHVGVPTYACALACKEILTTSVSNSRDVVRRVSVEPLLQTQLVEEVANEADGAADDEQAVERTRLCDIISLLAREGAAAAQQVDEGAGDGTVHVQDEVFLFRSRDRLNLDGVVEDVSRREVREHELFDQHDALVGVRHGLDAVACINRGG